MDEALDIQHDTDPAQEVPPARRIPHIGHALTYFSLNTFGIALGLLIALSCVHARNEETALQHPIAAALGQLGGYALTFAIAVPLFPLFWNYTFWQGIHWNVRRARLGWWKWIALGIALSLTAQFADNFIKSTADSDVLLLFKTPLSSWITAIVGSVVPALAEEVAFRGFLLPALATSYDWLSLDRTPQALQRWETTSSHTRAAWVFGAIISSLVFAGLHAFQLHGNYGAVAVLFTVSLAFCAIRIGSGSVAASFLAHAAYDALIFAELAWATGGFHHLDKLK